MNRNKEWIGREWKWPWQPVACDSKIKSATFDDSVLRLWRKKLLFTKVIMHLFFFFFLPSSLRIILAYARRKNFQDFLYLFYFCLCYSLPWELTLMFNLWISKSIDGITNMSIKMNTMVTNHVRCHTARVLCQCGTTRPFVNKIGYNGV